MTAKRNRKQKASATDQEKVLDLLRSAVENTPLTNPIIELKTAVDRAVELAVEIKELEDTLAEKKAARRHLTHEVIPQAMFEMGIVGDDNRGHVTVGGMYRIELYPRVFANVPVEKQIEFQKWLTDNGMGAIIKPTVHPKTLDATVNGLLDEGKGDIIPAYVKLFRQTEARIKGST